MSLYLMRKVLGAFRYTRSNANAIYITVKASTPSVKALPFTLISRHRKQSTYIITLMVEKNGFLIFRLSE